MTPPAETGFVATRAREYRLGLSLRFGGARGGRRGHGGEWDRAGEP